MTTNLTARLDELERRHAAEGEEIARLRTELTKPGPVAVCVGDVVRGDHCGRVRITAPTAGTDEFAGRCGVWWAPIGHDWYHVSKLRTLGGRAITHVVPFRLALLKPSGLYQLIGFRGVGSLEDVIKWAIAATRILWPWYRGPACVGPNGELLGEVGDD